MPHVTHVTFPGSTVGRAHYAGAMEPAQVPLPRSRPTRGRSHLPSPPPRSRAALATLAASLLVATGCAAPGDADGADTGGATAGSAPADGTTASAPDSAASPGDATDPSPGETLDLAAPSDVATGLEAPWSIAFHDGTAAGNHNGGRIAFGPDGMLYVTTGDAGDPSHAQDPDSPAGKILRLTPDGEIPNDNPVDGSPVHSLGHRNPQGLDWADDGTLYASEFGQDTWDELNVIEPGGNYGWPEVEGIGGGEFIDPVRQWRPAEASPSGLAVVDGSVVVASLRGERVWQVPIGEPQRSEDHLTGDHGRLRDVAEAPDGSLWILTNNTDGRGDPADGDDRVLRVPIE